MQNVFKTFGLAALLLIGTATPARAQWCNNCELSFAPWEVTSASTSWLDSSAEVFSSLVNRAGDAGYGWAGSESGGFQQGPPQQGIRIRVETSLPGGSTGWWCPPDGSGNCPVTADPDGTILISYADTIQEHSDDFVQSVLSHEMGHALGVAHPFDMDNCTDSIMSWNRNREEVINPTESDLCWINYEALHPCPPEEEYCEPVDRTPKPYFPDRSKESGGGEPVAFNGSAWHSVTSVGVFNAGR
jgi:hypothetical protein